MLLSAAPAPAYSPPEGPTNTVADPTRPMGHGSILERATAILEADDRADAAAFFRAHWQPLMDGMRAADEGAGLLEEVKMPFVKVDLTKHHVMRSAFTHFYNPRTGNGLTVRFGKLRKFLGLNLGLDLDRLVDAADALSIGPWESWTIRGPHPGSDRVADMAYARAVGAMRRDQPGAAMYHLGYALHMLADATVPQHAADEGGQTVGSHHEAFEYACDELLDRPWHALEGGEYGDDHAGERVASLASRSKPYLAAASDPATYEDAARVAMPMAERASAGLMDRFHRLWASEDFTVIRLKIREVHARQRMDPLNQADFYVKVDLDGEAHVSNPITGADHLRPDAVLPNVWEFIRRVENPDADVRIELWDHDPGDVANHDQADIDPALGDQALDLSIQTRTGWVSGDASGPLGSTFESEGEPEPKAGKLRRRLREKLRHLRPGGVRRRKRARIVYQIEAWPKPAPVGLSQGPLGVD